MMKREHALKGIVALAALATLALSIGHAAASEKQWIQGSWVNLRATAAANGAVLERLIVNTEVTLLSQQGTWCEVTAKTPAVRGFVACTLLGAQPLSLAEVGSPTLGTGEPNPLYSAPRAFWLAPSMVRLREAGDHFWRVMLAPEQKAREIRELGKLESDRRPHPVRYAIPEFEAMKDLMKRGVVAAPEHRPVLASWAELHQAVTRSADVPTRLPGFRGIPDHWLPAQVVPMLRHARLPPARPSLFQDLTDLAPAGSGVEQLSAQFGIVERLKVLSGPKWVDSRYNHPQVLGNWDIGSFEVSLVKPVLEYVIGRKGLAELRERPVSWHHDVALEESCSLGLYSATYALAQPMYSRPYALARPMPGYPKVKDPLVWLHVAKPVPFKKVRVTTAALKLPAPPKGQEEHPYPTIALHDIDIEGDGVPDLAVWEGMSRDGKGGDSIGIRVVFANVGGEWFVLDVDYYEKCGLP